MGRPIQDRSAEGVDLLLPVADPDELGVALGRSSGQVTSHTVGRTGFAEVVRRWPIVLTITLVAVTASLLAAAARTPSYSATAQLVITPLPQWDETFLGTSLVRDSGDANRTAATVAAIVDSPEAAREASALLGGSATEKSVREAVDVEPVGETNVLAVTALADNPIGAVQLADAFATGVLTLRWRAIERELDDRIALAARMAETVADDSDSDETAQASRTLMMIRSAGKDPTMTLKRSRPAVRVAELPTVVIAALALAGGLFVGGLVAVGLGRISEGPEAGPSTRAASRDLWTPPK